MAVIRNGAVVFRSTDQYMGVNVPFQFDNRPVMDTPEEREFIMERGDIILFSSDGLDDNLYPNEILKVFDDFPNARPNVHARELAQRAYEASNKVDIRIPFRDYLEANGREWNTGKQDDITALVMHYGRTYV
jgi:hypothetical protein